MKYDRNDEKGGSYNKQNTRSTQRKSLEVRDNIEEVALMKD